MHCTVCGATLRPTTSDLPFKVREHTIVIVKNLSVLECVNCAQYLKERRWLVPFARASREDDYHMAWTFFAAQATGQTTTNNALQG